MLSGQIENMWRVRKTDSTGTHTVRPFKYSVRVYSIIETYDRFQVVFVMQNTWSIKKMKRFKTLENILTCDFVEYGLFVFRVSIFSRRTSSEVFRTKRKKT